MRASITFWALGLSLSVLTGCASNKPNAAASLTGHPVVDAAPARDRVLVQYRSALTAMRYGRYDEARALLDDAILSMGGIATGDQSAKKARRLFSGEEKKKFLGEPYERAMAFYYRGILYWMDGEPDNARACFRSAQIHDSDTENKEYASDYVLLEYLDGLASSKLAADGSEAFARAQALNKSKPLLPYSNEANVLFFVDYGSGPIKYATGQYGEQLRFRNQASLARTAAIKVNGQALPAPPYDNLYFQATTRGGRVMDHILANKAVFKSTTSGVGDAAIISGAVLGSQQGRRSNVDEIGLGLALAGLVSKVLSAATVPAADTRTWDNLPQYLSFTSTSLPPGEHVATVEFSDGSGAVIPALTKTVTINIPPASRDSVIYVSDKSNNSSI